MTQSAYGLQYDVLGDEVSAEWRTIVAAQARTLEGVLHQAQAAVARVRRRTDSPQHTAERFQTLVADTGRFLADQARQNVTLEQDIAQLRALFSDLTNIPQEAAQRLCVMEQVNEVLHANLAATRRFLATLVEIIALTPKGYEA